MKPLHILPFLFLIFSCNHQEDIETIEHEITIPAFQTLLDSAQLKGALLVYDLEMDLFYSNDFEWANSGHLPASTFKIPNSIIGLETGVAKDDSTIFEWDGEQKMFDRWEQDLIFKDAFHYSCVPCYQELARKIGVKSMNEYLNDFYYGNMLVDSTNIDMFWLEGDSKISQFQQINFLRRLHLSELPISKRTDEIIKRMIVIEENEEYILRGKTGWSRQNDIDNGWFVGYVEVQDKAYFFATNIEPKTKDDINDFFKIRMDITMDALRELGIIE